VYLIFRTLVDAENADDVRAANALQDAIVVEQEKSGTFSVPNWDRVSLDKIRELLLNLGSFGGQKVMFGRKEEVDPVSYLIGAAGGWGGNPPSAAIYSMVYPKENDGQVAHQLTVKDVPVDGFWSISVYNAKGFFERNESNSYSLNNITAKPNPDGTVSIQFGGDPKSATNFLPITPGWNYTVRLYRPRKEVLEGKWKFPEALPMK
jgi:para-nitrobenzyl esterase